jgi:glycosyltransferase involved in cell wall biosynthesis
MIEVSIVVPVLHSPVLGETLASVKRQEFDLETVEVLVIGLDRYEFVEPDQTFQFIETGGSVSEARNIGIERARGGYLVFLDSDCIADAQWLSRLVARLDEGCPVVGGGLAVPGGSYYATCYNIMTFHEFLDVLPPGQRDYLPTVHLAMRREVAEAAGMMDPSLPRAEDIDWTIRIRNLGYTLHFEPRAVVRHHPETSLRRIFRKWVNTGYCSREVRQRHPSVLQAPRMLDSPIWLLLSSPAVALVAATRIFWRTPALLRYLHTWPVVFLAKLVWCWGAAAGAGAGWLERILIPEGKFST